MVSVKVDWLGITVKGGWDGMNSVLNHWRPWKEWDLGREGLVCDDDWHGRGMMTYKRSEAFGNGGIVRLYSPDRDDSHLMVRGAGCEWCLREGLDVMDLAQPKPGVTVKRLDFAFDGWTYLGKAISPFRVYLDLLSGKKSIRCPAEKSKFTFFATGVPMVSSTLYVGKRISDRMVRMYDARGFCRVELELKGKVAADVWAQVGGYGGIYSGKGPAGLLGAYMTILQGESPVGWWSAGLQGCQWAGLAPEDSDKMIQKPLDGIPF